MRMSSNNLSGQRYKKVTSLNIPQIELRLLLATGKGNHWVEVGRIASGVSADLYNAPKGWIKETDEQEAFLLEQDALTRRLAFMIGLEKKKSGYFAFV